MRMATTNRSKLSKSECIKSVRKFFEKQARFKKIQAEFNEMKAQFYSDMESYFEAEQIEGATTFESDEFADGDLQVTRTQKSSVEFNADKLEKALGKKLAKSVVLKQYQIIDMDGLIAYLKECNVDPSIFKSFLSVTKTVDTKELDRLEELGKVTLEQVKGCYSVKRQSPYFTVTVKRGQDDGSWQK